MTVFLPACNACIYFCTIVYCINMHKVDIIYYCCLLCSTNIVGPRKLKLKLKPDAIVNIEQAQDFRV